MTEQYPTIEDNPKAALQSFIQELEEFYYPWYDKATTRNYYTWFAAQAVALLSGFATALLAALLKEDTFRAWGTGRVLLIVLPLLGTLGSTFLVQTRIAELEALRERGRENIQRLANQARVDFAAATTLARYTEIHSKLVADVSTIEQEQSRGFQRLIPVSLGFHSQVTTRTKQR